MPISIPNKISVPWATSGLKNTIPPASDPLTGLAGYDQGFTAINMTPKTAGGIPPFGQDFNGAFFAVTEAIRYLETGALFPYDGTFATAVGGYPLGSLLQRTDGYGLWRNTVADNTTDPEAFGAGWAPEGSGITSVAMSNVNVTLTALQAARNIVVITGTLTANLNLVFPTYQRQWLVVNGASGAFSVTCKTASGSGVSISTGESRQVYGDGTNIATAGQDGTQSAAVASFSNLKASATGTNANISVTSDEMVLENSSNRYRTARGVSVNVNSSTVGANGLDTGSTVASTWYALYVIGKEDGTIAGLISLSATSPTMPSGYTYKARVGWIRTDGTANKYPLIFKQNGKKVRWGVAAGSNLTSLQIMASGVAGTITPLAWVAIGVSAYSPPTASSISVTPLNANVATGVTVVAPNNSITGSVNTATPTSPALYSLYGVGTGGAYGTHTGIVEFMLESSNIYWASNSTNSGVVAIGWEDNL